MCSLVLFIFSPKKVFFDLRIPPSPSNDWWPVPLSTRLAPAPGLRPLALFASEGPRPKLAASGLNMTCPSGPGSPACSDDGDLDFSLEINEVTWEGNGEGCGWCWMLYFFLATSKLQNLQGVFWFSCFSFFFMPEEVSYTYPQRKNLRNPSFLLTSRKKIQGATGRCQKKVGRIRTVPAHLTWVFPMGFPQKNAAMSRYVGSLRPGGRWASLIPKGHGMSSLGGGNSNIFGIFTPEKWVVQPPTRSPFFWGGNFFYHGTFFATRVS